MFVNLENAAVIRAMLEIYAINCLVIHVVLNMVNAKMALAFAHKDGMDVIALCVSTSFQLIQRNDEKKKNTKTQNIHAKQKKGHTKNVIPPRRRLQNLQFRTEMFF